MYSEKYKTSKYLLHLLFYNNSNILGQKVAILVYGEQKAGYKTASLDADSLSSGIHFYRLEVKGYRLKVTKTSNMALLK